MVLTGTLVTPDAPRTAKLAKSGARIGAADAEEAAQIAPIMPNARVTNVLTERALYVLPGGLDVIFMRVTLWKMKVHEDS
jgi:hypothetical protein